MKAFHFTLQGLLQSREALENVVTTRLAAAVRDLEKARRELHEMVVRMKKDIESVESLRGTCMGHDTLSVHLKYIDRLQCAIVAQSEKVAVLEAGMEKCRNELHEAMRERKSLDRLLELERDRWKEEGRRFEQKEMDEHGHTGHNRHKTNDGDSV
jgi:flagellar export protein FliJ